MAQEPGGGVDRSDDAGHESEIKKQELRIRYLKVAILAHIFATILQVVIVLSATVIPLIAILMISVLNMYVEPMLVFTVSPVGVSLGGEGLRATTLVIVAAVSIIGKRLYRLSTRGYPWPEITPTGTNTEDGGNTNDDD